MAFKFETLRVWKEAVAFASEIYSLSKKFPRAEKFGLTSQLNRAAVSVSLNLAEGEGRKSNADLVRFIHIAIGSLYEVVTILHISAPLNKSLIVKGALRGCGGDRPPRLGGAQRAPAYRRQESERRRGACPPSGSAELTSATIEN